MSSSDSAIAAYGIDPQGVRFGFDNTYARLPERFYARVAPVAVAAPRLIKVNGALAEALGLDAGALASAAGVAVLAGNAVAEGSEPMALAYAGHQFGHFVPALGDGRACLLGEVVGVDEQRFDVQLKGSGPTPFSRRGDGRAALGPVLREYVVSEAMAALGVPTTRALAAVTTGQSVVRETVQPGAVFVRVAASHLRVGTFQYFAARGDVEGLRVLADYAMARHYPECAGGARPYRSLLDGMIARQARLIARWVCLGFIHGVMNTDNMAVSGETIDYGPCAFMEAYDPATVFSSIDRNERYAYANQPNAAHWNLTRLAEAMLPLLNAEEGSEEAGLASAVESLGGFAAQYDAARLAGFRAKLGLEEEREGDDALVEDLLARMAANHADFTLTFRRLADGDVQVRALFDDPGAYDAWAAGWRERLTLEGASVAERSGAMRRVSPARIARNHRVAEVIDAAVERADFGPFEELLRVFAEPYEDRPEWAAYEAAALPAQMVHATFCGT